MKAINFLIGIIWMLTACNKTDNKKPFYSMDPEFKKTFLQGQEGSYWVYADSLGQAFDTVTLVRLSKEIDGLLDEDGDESEAYSTHYVATNCRNYFTRLSTLHTYDEKGAEKTIYFFDWMVTTGTVTKIELRDGKYLPERDLITLDSIKLLGKMYYNIIKLTGGNGYRNVIIDPKIGIIYKEAAAERPAPAGTKKFYLKEYHLK